MSANNYGIAGARSAKAAETAKAPLNVPALLSLISSLLCFFPVGLVLGVVGLVQTKNGAMSGRVLAVLGLIFSSLQTAFLIFAVAIAPDDGVTADNAKERAAALEAEVDADIAAGL